MTDVKGYVNLNSAGYGMMVVEADGGTRRQRGSAIAAERRQLERAYYVTITGVVARSYIETWGFQTRTRMTYSVRSSDLPPDSNPESKG